MKWFKIFLISLALAMFVLGAWSHTLLDIVTVNTMSKTQSNEISECKDFNLQQTANCLRDNLKEIYNYTERDDLPKTEEDIKLNGGDCNEYSYLYQKWARQLGFNSDTHQICDGVFCHRFATINDKTGYCILDQLVIKCGGYAVE